MEESEIRTNVDFLSIALEEMDNGNHEIAQEFVEDVYTNLLDELE